MGRLYKGNLFKKTGAVVSVVYFLTNVAFAYSPEGNVWDERRKSREDSRKSDPLLLAGLPKGSATPQAILDQLSQVKEQPLSPQMVAKATQNLTKNVADRYAPLLSALPFAQGTIRNINVPKGYAAKTIVHIQDVHLNEEAQRNIGGAVQSLLDHKKIDLVALEGAFDTLQMEEIRGFPHKDVIEGVADYMLRHGKISGAVYTGLTNASPGVPFVGVDDKTHYDANVEAYRRSEKAMAPVAAALREQQKILDLKKSSVFNAALQIFDKNVQAYHAETLSLTRYVKFLVNQDPSGAGINVRTLAQAADLENSLDFKEVESDRAQLIKVLVNRLGQNEISTLLRQSVAYRLGQIPHGAFYASLKDLCRNNGVDLAKFKAMDGYIRYVLLSDRINADALFSEMTRGETTGYERLAITTEEIELVDQTRLNGLSLKLANFSLTPEEWKDYAALRTKMSGGFAEKLASFESFYTEAEARNDAITEKLLKAMDQSGARTAVLVTGGFHAPGIESRLAKANVATIAYVPKITQVDTKNGSAYLSVFTQEKTPLEKLFEGQKLFTAPKPFDSTVAREMKEALSPVAVVAGKGNTSNVKITISGAQTSWKIVSGSSFVSFVTRVVANLKENGGILVKLIQTEKRTATVAFLNGFSSLAKAGFTLAAGVLGVSFPGAKAKDLAEKVFGIWRRSYDIAPPADAEGRTESLKTVREKRVRPAYKELIEPKIMKGQHVLLSAHGNALRALVMDLFDLNPGALGDFTFPLATPVRVVFDGTVVAEVEIIQPEGESRDQKNVDALAALLRAKGIKFNLVRVTAQSRAKEAWGGELILVRHGETVTSDTQPGGGLFAGQLDVSLTEGGRKDGKRAGLALNAYLGGDYRIGAVYSSDLMRARDTMVQVLSGMGRSNLSITEEPRFRERHYGALQGKSRGEFRKELVRRIEVLMTLPGAKVNYESDAVDVAKDLSANWDQLTELLARATDLPSPAAGAPVPVRTTETDVVAPGAGPEGSAGNATLFFVWLSDARKEMTSSLGGKTANLGEMIAKGLAGSVPKGYAVTAEGFQEFLGHNEGVHEQIGKILEDVDTGDAVALNKATEVIQEIVMKCVVPDVISKPIEEYLVELARITGVDPEALRLAVRSSGVQEDLEIPEAMKKALEEEKSSGSSAGQQSTYLNVRQRQVLRRFVQCAASLYNSQAISYRDTQGLLAFLGNLGNRKSDVVRAMLASGDEQVRTIGNALNRQIPVSRVRLLKALEAVAADVTEGAMIVQMARESYAPYIDPKKLSISVVFQKMVHSRVSYTVFSYDNRSGWAGLSFNGKNIDLPKKGRVFRFDVSYGLGEAVVQGLTNPDNFLVHIFEDEQGKTHVNILEKNLGSKKIQILYVEDLLKKVVLGEQSLAERELMQLVRIVRSEDKDNRDDRRQARAEARDVLDKLGIRPNQSRSFSNEINRAANYDFNRLDEYEAAFRASPPKDLESLNIDPLSFVRLAHLITARRHDAEENTVKTFVDFADQAKFCITDDKAREIALLAKKATDIYNDVRDMEGGEEQDGLEAGELKLVQSRSITTETEVNTPGILSLKKTVVNEAAAKKAEENFSVEPGKEVGSAAEGVKGRNAVVGEIFVLNKASSEPYEKQLARAQQRAEQLEAENKRTGGNKKLVLVTKFTTPQDEPAMKVSGGIVAFEGGDTSHAAIVSRELKLATVVGISEFLEKFRREDPERWKAVEKYLWTSGRTLTVDANNGKIYLGALPIETQEVRINIPRLPKLLYTMLGLIIASAQAMREVSKIGQYVSHYAISLFRAEFSLVSIGIHPRAVAAYDMMTALEREAAVVLDERQLDDVERLSGNPALIESIRYKIRGYGSARDYYVGKLSESIASAGAANGIHQKVQYRMTDFKQNEMNKMLGGPEFALQEEATMIGDRGAGWILKEENRAVFNMELEALRRAYDMGYENIGIMLPFVRTPEELAEFLKRLRAVDFPLQSVGMMVELPINIVRADEFAEMLAAYGRERGVNVYFSFGTNDLTQLTRGVGREEPQVTELFKEEHETVIESIRHVANVVSDIRGRYPDLDFTLGLCGQAIVKLVDSDPASARKIATMLDSSGLDILAYQKVVKLMAEAELEISELDASKNPARLDEIASGTSSKTVGAAARRVVVVKSLQDLEDVYVGDFVLLDGDFQLRLEDLGEIKDIKFVQEVLDRIDRDSLSRELKIYASAIRAKLGNEAYRSSIEFRAQFRRLLMQEAFDKAGALFVSRGVDTKEKLVELFAMGETDGALLGISVLGKTLADKPLVQLGGAEMGALLGRNGQIVSADFGAGKVYGGELSFRKRILPAEPDIFVRVENPREPRSQEALAVSANEFYREMGMHPLVFKQKHGEEGYKDFLRRLLRNAAARVSDPSSAWLLYRTSDLNSNQFRSMSGGKAKMAAEEPEENAPLGLRGIYRFLKVDERGRPNEYRRLLEIEMQVIREMREEFSRQGITLGVEITNVTESTHVDGALKVMRDQKLIPGADFPVGVRIENPDNYLLIRRYLNKGLAFVSIDQRRLSQMVLAAHRNNPHVSVDDKIADEGLRPIVNVVKDAAAEKGVAMLRVSPAFPAPRDVTPQKNGMESRVGKGTNFVLIRSLLRKILFWVRRLTVHLPSASLLLPGRVSRWAGSVYAGLGAVAAGLLPAGLKLVLTAVFVGAAELFAFPSMVLAPKRFAARHGDQKGEDFAARLGSARRLQGFTWVIFLLSLPVTLLGAPDMAWTGVLGYAAAASIVGNAAIHAVIDTGEFRKAMKRAEGDAKLIVEVMETGTASEIALGRLLLSPAGKVGLENLAGQTLHHPLYSRLLQEAMVRELSGLKSWERKSDEIKVKELLEGLLVAASAAVKGAPGGGNAIVPVFIKSADDIPALMKKLPTDAGAAWTVVPVLMGREGNRAWLEGEAALKAARGHHTIEAPVATLTSETIEAPVVAELLDTWAARNEIVLKQYRLVLALSRGLQWDPASMDLLPADHPLREADVFVLGLYMPFPIKMIQFLDLQILADRVIAQMA